MRVYKGGASKRGRQAKTAGKLHRTEVSLEAESTVHSSTG
jgi:hypothetical protein